MASYFVDNAGGNDSNAGTSSGAAWQHCPGDSAATGNAAACTPVAGDKIYFKQGVTYSGVAGALITVKSSGALVASGADGTMSATGLLSSASGDFLGDGVDPATDFVLVYHNKESVTGTWVEVCGLYPVVSVSSATQLQVGYTGRAWSVAELPYRIVRPVQYTTKSDWGSGAATISGMNNLATVLDLGSRSHVRVDGLKFVDTISNGDRTQAAIKGSGSSNIQIVDCVFDNTLNAGCYILAAAYSVLSGNTITNFNGWGLCLLGESCIQEYNSITGKGTTDSVRSGLGGARFAIIRFNTVKDIVGTWGGYHADSIGYIDGGSPNQTNSWGWIYGNTIENYVEGIALYYTGGGTVGWVIHSNVVICRRSTTGKGDSALMLNGCDGLCVFNNTFVGLDGSALGSLGSTAICFENRTPDSKNCRIENNLFLSASASVVRFDATEHTGTVCDNNHYYSGSASPFWYEGVAQDLTAWKALGYDTTGFHASNGLGVDPQVTNLAGLDFTLSVNSPDKTAGTDLSTIFMVDHAGNTRTSWSIGAFDFVSGEGGGDCLVLEAVGDGVLALAVG